VVLEIAELLENNDSNAISQNLGEFNTQTIVDDYWTASYGGVTAILAPESPITASDGTIFVNGVVISGSENLASGFSQTNLNLRDDAYIEYRMKPSADWNSDGSPTSGINILSAGSYTITFKAASEVVPDITGGSGNPTIRVYVSGSAIDPETSGEDKLKIDTIISTTGGIASSTGGTAGAPPPLGFTPATDTPDPLQIYDPEDLVYYIDVQRAGTLSVIFQIPYGRWYISDVSIKATAETGFTPNYTIVDFHVANDSVSGDFVDFKFELYDNIGNKVHTKTIHNMEWTGGNTHIDGSDNILAGTINVG